MIFLPSGARVEPARFVLWSVSLETDAKRRSVATQAFAACTAAR